MPALSRESITAWEQQQTELEALLAPLLQVPGNARLFREITLPLRCRKCYRVLAVARVHEHPWGIDWAPLEGRDNVHVSSPDPFLHTRDTIACSRRCGASYTVSQKRSCEAFARAVHTGRTVIVAGVDL